jgi:hypothetical protein
MKRKLERVKKVVHGMFEAGLRVETQGFGA